MPSGPAPDHDSQNEASAEGAIEGSELPNGWHWGTLGDVAESMKNGIYKPSSSYADDGVACLRMYNIGDGKIVWRNIKRMRLSENEIREYELLPGDLLVNRVNSRELVGKSVAIPTGLERCVFESKNIRVRFRRDLVSPEFVSYRLLSAGSHYFTQNAQQVVGMASISQQQVARFPLPLPPLPEQRRIVAEIEKQFTRLEAGVEALRRVQANLKRYRAAVLKAACEGQLVPTEAELHRQRKSKSAQLETGAELLIRILSERRKNWQGRGKYKEPAAPDAANLPQLPECWTWATLEQLCSLFADSAHRTPEYGDSGVPALGPRDVVGGKLDLENARLVNDGEFAIQTARHVPQAGDIVYSRELSLGWGALIPDGRRVCLSQGMCVFRTHHEVNTRYFLALLNGPVGRKHAAAAATGSAHPHINLVDIKGYVFPLPPLAEQTRIVAEVERRLSVVDGLETVVSANLQRASRLRQSILQKAFTGELIAQRSQNGTARETKGEEDYGP